MCDRLADGQIGHAGFDDSDTIVEVDFADALEFAKTEQNAVLEWQARRQTATCRTPRGTTFDAVS